MGWLSRTAKSIRDRAKRTTRSVMSRVQRVRPYVTGALTAGLTYINPALGLGFGAARGATGRYVGATAARHDGLSGHEAREAGRRQREKEFKAAGIGAAAGALTAVAVGSPWTGSGIFGAQNYNAAAEGAMAAYESAGGPAAHGVAVKAPAAINFSTGAGSHLPLVSQSAEGAYNLSAQATMEAYAAAGGPASHGVAVPAGGGGFLDKLPGVLQDTAKALLPTAQTFLANQLPPHTPAPIVDLAGAILGGSGAGGAPAEPESVSDAFALREWSTGAKLAAAAGVTLGGFVIYRLVKKKAA